MDECPWCKFNAGEGKECPAGETCDFRGLPYEKEAIIARMAAESVWIDQEKRAMAEKEDQAELEKSVGEMIDRAKGMQIMMDRLIADFGMTQQEVKEAAGLGQQKMGFGQKVMLAKRIAELQKKERGRR